MKRRKLLCLLLALGVMLPSPFAGFAQDKDMKKIKKYFKMDLHQLLNIEVTTAGKKKEKIGDIPASVVLVTREDIETFGYQSLGEILENIPGLYVTDDYLQKNIGVRGFWAIAPNRNMIIQVNGVPCQEGISASYILENIAIPVEAIDKIEVVRGPMSVIYGNGALFGVINIITDQTMEKDSLNMVSFSAGSDKTTRLFARASGQTGNFRYSLNAGYLNSNGLNVSMEDIGGPDWIPDSTDGLLEQRDKYVNAAFSIKGISFNLIYSERMKESFFIMPAVAEGTDILYKDLRVGFGYEKRFSDKLRAQFKFSYFLDQLNYDYDFFVKDIYGVQENGASGYKAELSAFFEPSSRLDITLGVNYNKVLSVTNDYTIPFFGFHLVHHALEDGDAIVTQSVFAQVNFRISSRLKLVAGAMIEQAPKYTLSERIGDYQTFLSTYTQVDFEEAGAEFIPRLALIYAPNDKHVFKFLYGKAINRPSFFQNVDLFIKPGADPLKPETINTLELNYIGHLSSRVTVSFSVFHNMLDKLLYRTLFASGGETDVYHTNVGEMTTTGAELIIKAEPISKLRLELSATYQETKDNRDGFEDIDVAYSPNFLGYAKVSYFFTKNISLAMSGNFVDKMQPYFDDSVPTPARLGKETGSYFLLGANLRIRGLFGTGMFVNLRCSNILDEEIRYPATSNNSLYAPDGNLGRGMSFLVTLGWKF